MSARPSASGTSSTPFMPLSARVGVTTITARLPNVATSRFGAVRSSPCAITIRTIAREISRSSMVRASQTSSGSVTLSVRAGRVNFLGRPRRAVNGIFKPRLIPTKQHFYRKKLSARATSSRTSIASTSSTEALRAHRRTPSSGARCTATTIIATSHRRRSLVLRCSCCNRIRPTSGSRRGTANFGRRSPRWGFDLTPFYNRGKAVDATYKTSPQYAYLGAPKGRSGIESASVPGAIYRNVWLGRQPRPASLGSALQ